MNQEKLMSTTSSRSPCTIEVRTESFLSCFYLDMIVELSSHRVWKTNNISKNLEGVESSFHVLVELVEVS